VSSKTKRLELKKAEKLQRISKFEQKKKMVATNLKSLGEQLYQQFTKKQWPAIRMPSRSTSNIHYDLKTKQYILGDQTVKRSASNVRHIRPLTQLVWTGSFVNELTHQGKTSTLRDVFYSAQAYEMSFTDQAESDDIITDLETVLGNAREDFNVFPEERSAIFGDMTIEFTVKGYEGKTLNLASHPDGLMIGPALVSSEFYECKADKIIAIEKGGLFTRFIEEKVHEKYHALLIHTAGQAPRATRALMRRMNDELGLPVYIFCDADPWGMHIANVIISGSVRQNEPIVVKDSKGTVRIEAIGSFVDRILRDNGFTVDPHGNEVCYDVPYETLTVDKGNSLRFKPMSAVVRHFHQGSLYSLTTQSGRTVTVTPNHSVFILRKGQITSIPTSEIRKGELMVIGRNVSTKTTPTALINVVEVLLNQASKRPLLYVTIESARSKYHRRRRLETFNSEQKAPKLAKHERTAFISCKRAFDKVQDMCPVRIWLSEEFARLLGYYVSEGYLGFSDKIPRNVNMTFGLDEADIVDDAERCVKSVFPRASTHKSINRQKHSITLTFGGTPTALLFQAMCGEGFDEKHVPSVIIGADREYVIEFLKGCFGNGYITNSGGLCWKMKNPPLITELTYLMMSIGVLASIEKSKNIALVSGASEVEKVTKTILHDDDKNTILQRLASTKTGSQLMPKAFPVSACGLTAYKSTILRHKNHSDKCKNLYRRICEVIQNGTEGSVNRSNLTAALEHVLSCGIEKVDQVAEEKLRQILQLVTSDIAFDPVVDIAVTPMVSENVYDVSVPEIERFIGGRAGFLLHNSANAAHLRELNTPDAKWCGVTASDIVKYKLPSDPLTELDIKRLHELEKDPRYDGKLWQHEIATFLKNKRKSEQEAFSRYGLAFIVDKYLPDKFKEIGAI
jgi:DNA topoisomerase-6 subunit A